MTSKVSPSSVFPGALRVLDGTLVTNTATSRGGVHGQGVQATGPLCTVASWAPSPHGPSLGPATGLARPKGRGYKRLQMKSQGHRRTGCVLWKLLPAAHALPQAGLALHTMVPGTWEGGCPGPSHGVALSALAAIHGNPHPAVSQAVRLPSCSGAWCSNIKGGHAETRHTGSPTPLCPPTTLLLGLKIFPRFPGPEMPLTLRCQPSVARVRLSG